MWAPGKGKEREAAGASFDLGCVRTLNKASMSGLGMPGPSTVPFLPTAQEGAIG
jgi:hypothetical protein